MEFVFVLKEATFQEILASLARLTAKLVMETGNVSYVNQDLYFNLLLHVLQHVLHKHIAMAIVV